MNKTISVNIQTQEWKYSPEYYRLSTEILDTALHEVEFFRSWQSFDPGKQFPVDARYHALPALTKKDIREHFPRGLLPAGCDLEAALAAGKIHLVETSGTTDDKVTNIWNQEWWDASERASWRLNSQMSRIATGEHREAILVNPRNVGLISDDHDLPMEKRRLARFLYLNEKTDPLVWSTDLMSRMIEEINIFQPAVLEANPSYLARLCRFISSTRQPVFQPGMIVFTYEYPTHFHIRQVKQVFTSPVVSSYGTTETGYVFIQCEAGNLHQNSEYCRVDFEPLQTEHGGPVLGRILVTPLRNPWSYLMRFDTGDLVSLKPDGQCPCGRNSGLILSSVDGRETNLTQTCSGRLVSLHELDNAVSILEGAAEYQLFQVNQETYELHLVSSRKDTAILKEQAEKTLKKVYGRKARIDVIFENDIVPESSGKYQVSRALFPIDLEKYLDKKRPQ